eukprot:GHVT01048802.1.p1 GENE.GHVT01048802.1~~GHVT01048802.1.p1  ORF type:complete len:274 (+),score=36.42 GHVT01048802.1:967-1788(+)
MEYLAWSRNILSSSCLLLPQQLRQDIASADEKHQKGAEDQRQYHEREIVRLQEQLSSFAEDQTANRDLQQQLREKERRNLATLQGRVREALGRKDQDIHVLKEEVHAAEAKAGRLQELLKKQREDLLGGLVSATPIEETYANEGVGEEDVPGTTSTGTERNAESRPVNRATKKKNYPRSSTGGQAPGGATQLAFSTQGTATAHGRLAGTALATAPASPHKKTLTQPLTAKGTAVTSAAPRVPVATRHLGSGRPGTRLTPDRTQTGNKSNHTVA